MGRGHNLPTAGITDDITIESVGGTPKIGFMLARDRRNLRRWTIKDAETIQPRVLTMGELTQAEQRPEIELVWFQDDWDNGLGADNHRTDPKKLSASSRKIDTSRDGKLRMSRDLRATTVDTVPTGSVYDASGFALVEPNATGNPMLWSFNGRSVYEWNHETNAWVQGTDPQAEDCIYRNGTQYGIKTYVPSWDRALGWRLYPYIYKSESDANWVVSTAAESRFKFFAKTRNAYGDEVLWGGFNIYDSTVNLNAAVTDTTGTTLTVTPDPTNLIANNDIIMIDTEKMLVTARTSTTLTVVRGYDASTAATHSNAADIFIYAPHVIRSSVDPTNAGGWSTAVTIGVDDHPITALVTDGDTLIICKTNGIWVYYPDGSTENLTPDLENQRHTDNFHGAYNWNGHILMPFGVGGMVDLSGGQIRDVSLQNYMPTEVPMRGRIVAIDGDPQYVFLLLLIDDQTVPTAVNMYSSGGLGSHITAVSAGTPSLSYFLMMGTYDTDFRWQHLATLPYTTNATPNHAAIMVDSGNSESLTGNTNSKHRRVWISIKGSGAVTDAERLPRYLPYGKVGADENDGFSDDTDVEAITGKYDGNLTRVDKQFATLEIESENLATDRTCAVYYRLDNATAWTLLGTLNTATAYQTLTFADGVTGKVIELRLVFSRTGAVSQNSDIAVLSFKLTAQLRPASVKTIPINVYLADQQTRLNGTIRSSVKGDLAQLRTWNGQPAEVIMKTPAAFGSARNCVFVPGSLVEKETGHEYGRRSELECSFTLVEV